MHVWIDLLSRELLFLALLTLLGLGPAAWLLPERFDRAARVAVAPVLGMCLGACLTVTTVYAFPASQTAWLVVTVAAASAAAGVAKLGRCRRLPRPRTVAQMVLVLAVVLVTLDYPLADLHTVGPIGGYKVGDAAGYIGEIVNEQRYSLHQIDRLHAPVRDLTKYAWAVYAQGSQQLDIAPLQANVNALIGLPPTDTQTEFLIAVIAAGALGAFGAVRAVARRATWAAPFAGCLFAGPLFVELLMDGSEAALAGGAVLAPLAVIGWEAIRHRRWPVLVAAGLMAAGLQTLYPLFVPAMAIGGGAAMVAVAAFAGRRDGIHLRSVSEVAVQLGGVLLLTAALSPVATVRNVNYATKLLTGALGLSTLPIYHLPLSVLPGWLLQTREFYDLVPVSRAGLGVLVGALAIPVLVIGVIAFGALRHRTAATLAAVAAAAIVLAEYNWLSKSCGYCVQRNLLPIGALAPAALGVGLAALAAWRWRPGPVVAAIIGTLVLVLVGREGLIERERVQHGAYVVTAQLRRAAARIPHRSGPVELEGFGESVLAAMELPQTYDLLKESTNAVVSLPTIGNDFNSLAYLGGPAPLGPSFVYDYQYVLTRLGAIATDRRTVARFGPIALQRRVGDLDVTLIGGTVVADPGTDPRGTAWVGGPLAFLIAGGTPNHAAWVSITLRRTVPVKVTAGDAVVSSRISGSRVSVCLRALGTAPVRTAGVAVAFTPQPPAESTGYRPPLPARGVRLTSMRVSATSCRANP